MRILQQAGVSEWRSVWNNTTCRVRDSVRDSVPDSVRVSVGTRVWDGVEARVLRTAGNNVEDCVTDILQEK